jgi:hypothetical protein
VNKEFLFGCGTADWDDPDHLGRDGIHGGHAYSVLRAVEYEGERLLLMKNPWGEQEWNGPWSDGSSQWNPKSIEALGHTFGDDGVFWIRYSDMLRKYEMIWRTRLLDSDWKVTQQWTSLAIPWSGDYQETKFEITIAQETPTVIVLSKLDERYFQGLTGQYDFIPSFRVHRKGEEDYIMRTFSGCTWERSVATDLTLEAGTYEVRIKITGTRDEGKDKVEDVIKDNWLDRRDKLLQIGQSYDLAHAKAQIVDTGEKENEEKVKEDKAEEDKAKETSAKGREADKPEGDKAKDEKKDTEKAHDDKTDDAGPDMSISPIDGKGNAPFDNSEEAPAADAKPGDKPKEEDKPDAPWSAVAVVGLRVYCKDADATIKIVRPKPPVTEEKKLAKLDVDDPARDAAKGADVKEKEKEDVKVDDGKKEEIKETDDKKVEGKEDDKKDDKKDEIKEADTQKVEIKEEEKKLHENKKEDVKKDEGSDKDNYVEVKKSDAKNGDA